MKYLVKVDYACPRVKTNGEWFILESEIAPKLGVIDSEPFAGGIMPGHGCKNYYYSDNCDMDGSCNWQVIEEIKPYTEEESIKLNAKSLEDICKEAIVI